MCKLVIGFLIKSVNFFQDETIVEFENLMNLKNVD